MIMRRQLKFRVWDFKLSRFRKEQDCNDNESDIITIGLDGSLRGQYYSDHTILQPERYVIQQFTGLFDSNNKEIYEGDVLKFSSDFYDDEICEVKFGKGIFDGGHYSYMGFYLQKGEKILEPRQITSLTNGEGLFKVEVIGNSFNNQELLS